MRIIAGVFKGVRLPVPRGKAVRPTTDRVREALFSILGAAVDGSRVLELFAGTGAFGLEALSRGADSAVFVDHDRKVINSLGGTVRALGLQDRVKLLVMPALKAVTRLAAARDKFRIVYLDPPYATDWIARVVSDPLLTGLLEPDGLVVVEKDAHAPDLQVPELWQRKLSRKYGQTMVEIFML